MQRRPDAVVTYRPRNADDFPYSSFGLHTTDYQCTDGKNIHTFRDKACTRDAGKKGSLAKFSSRRSGIASTIHGLAEEQPDFETEVGSRTEPRGFFRYRAIGEVGPISPTDPPECQS